jgi:dTDP-4-dehydrorhamnose reductase
MSERLAWITGAGGLIGNYLIQTAPKFASGWQIVPISRERLDLADFEAVTRVFVARKPALVIHCAALSRAAACQADPPLAHHLNVALTRHLCGLAAAIPLVFFSTDLVFDGRKGCYGEADPVNPLSVYAETKVKAEQVVLRNPRHTVVRVALNTGVSPAGNRSFTEEMRRAWARGETLQLFTDEFRCPIPAVVTARAVWELIGRAPPGLYHLGGSERLSRWEIGRLLQQRWPALAGRIEATSVKDFPGPPRPADTSLDCTKIQRLLSFPLPGLTRWLEENPGEPV